MELTEAARRLPLGHLACDPDAPALRRPDGTIVVRFSARGMTRQAIEREALEDLLRTSRERPGGEPHPLERPRRPRPT